MSLKDCGTLRTYVYQIGKLCANIFNEELEHIDEAVSPSVVEQEQHGPDIQSLVPVQSMYRETRWYRCSARSI